MFSKRGRTFILLCLALALAVCGMLPAEATNGPYQANGLKIGELTSTSAIIWTRLTRDPRRLDDGIPLPAPKRIPHPKRPGRMRIVTTGPQLPEGVSVDEVEGAVPGAPGEVRVVYSTPAGKHPEVATKWARVSAERDFTHQFLLEGLHPHTEYVFRVECRASEHAPLGQTLRGRFRTAPSPDEPKRVVFTVVTGQMYAHRDCADGFKVYPVMGALHPDFFVHTGDILYYDAPMPVAKNLALARYHWHRMYSLPSLVEFHRKVPSYFMKDDHDTWQNDCWPTKRNNKMGDFTFAQGLAVFREQVPMGKLTYRTVRWGKDLQIWMVEGRDYRSPNTMEDGPDKTIWGAEQKAWLKRTVLDSDATFKVLISPTPIVGPDRETKQDNHANKAFAHEGSEIRRWIRDNAPNLVVVCGDRHWQYVSVDPETGVREYCCGPVSNRHAGGFKKKIEAYHRYFKVVGGFLAGIVERVNGQPMLTFRHYGVDGKVLFEDRLAPRHPG